VLLSSINKKIKDKILEMFTFGDTTPDPASIKDGWMALPALYEGVRKAEVKYNKGNKLDLTSLINKIKIELMITKETRTKINENVVETHIFNMNRQQKIINECVNELNCMVEGNVFNTIQLAISKLALCGVTNSMIEDIVLPYESNLSKVNGWMQWIDKCCSSYNPITYFNRYELKEFEGESYIYDNELTLYKDEISNKWLVNFPRNSNKDYSLLYENNALYRYLYDNINDYKMSLKVKTFIDLIMSRLTDEMYKSPKYDFEMLRGVKLRYSEWRTIQFHIFKFRNIIFNKPTEEYVKENRSVNGNLEVFEINVDNVVEDDLQIKVLKCLKDLVYYCYNKSELTGNKQHHYFSPKPLLNKLLNN